MCPLILKAILFDFDDTLVDTLGFFRHHLHKTLIEIFGPDYDNKYMVTAEELYNNNLPFDEIFFQTFGEDTEKFLQRYREISLNRKYQARAGMLNFVKALADQSVFLMILSNRTRLIKYRLTQAGYDPNQFRIFHAEKKKPHPLAYVEVIDNLKYLGISAKETIIIGNHPDDYDALPDDYKTESIFIALPTNDQTKEAFLKMAENNHQSIHICNHISELSKVYGRIL